MRRWWSMAVIVVVGALLWALHPAGEPGDAGADVRAARPGPSARLEQSPRTIELDLGRSWSTGSAFVQVTGPDDVDRARGLPVATAGGLTQRLAPLEEQGAYQVTYRVPTADGQVVAGSYWFLFTPHALVTGRQVSALVCLGLLALLVAIGLAGRRRAPHASSTATAAGPPPGPSVPAREQSAGPSVPRQRDRTDGDRVPPVTGNPRPPRAGGGRDRAPAPAPHPGEQRPGSR